MQSLEMSDSAAGPIPPRLHLRDRRVRRGQSGRGGRLEAGDRAPRRRNRGPVLPQGQPRPRRHAEAPGGRAGHAGRQALRQRPLALGRRQQAAGPAALARPSLPDAVRHDGPALRQADRLIVGIRGRGAGQSEVHAGRARRQVHQVLLAPQYHAGLQEVRAAMLGCFRCAFVGFREHPVWNWLEFILMSLFFRRPDGPKYKRAREWQTSVVNAQWLTDLLCGQMNALHQSDAPKYQQFSLGNPFRLDYSLVPHLMGMVIFHYNPLHYVEN